MPAIFFSMTERRITTWGNNGENVVLAEVLMAAYTDGLQTIALGQLSIGEGLNCGKNARTSPRNGQITPGSQRDLYLKNFTA